MDYDFQGSIVRLDQLKSGDFVLFDVDSNIHCGICVVTSEENKFIIDFDGVNKDEQRSFEIVSGSALLNEDFIHVQSAKIVPENNILDLGKGYPGGSLRSAVLYLTDEGPVVVANRQGISYKLRLTDGAVVTKDLSDSYHAKRWEIKIGNVNGIFEAIRSYSVD